MDVNKTHTHETKKTETRSTKIPEFLTLSILVSRKNPIFTNIPLLQALPISTGKTDSFHKYLCLSIVKKKLFEAVILREIGD